MIKIQKYYLITLILVFSGIGFVSAQNQMGLYFMETIPQSSEINPAMQPRANTFIALPSVSLSLQSDLGFNDVFQDQGSEWVTPISKRYNYDDLYSVTGKAVNLNNNLHVAPIGFGFRSGRDYFSFSVSVKNELQIGVPSDLFKIPENGFPNGSSFDFSTFRMKEAAYHELAFGYSREWDDRWTFGAKFKPLFGIAGAVTNINRFELNTSRESWDIIADGTVSVSGPVVVEESEEPGDFPENIDEKELEDDEIAGYAALSNGGLAFDFGAVYEFDEYWTFSAALNNLGYVRFKNDLNSLSFNGAYAFEGIEVDSLHEDEIDRAVEAISDSLEAVIDYDVSHDKFSVPLTPSLFMGASYQWTPAVSFGFLSRSVFQKHNFRQDFSLSANVQPYSFVALNLNYSKRIGGGNGLGTAFSVLAGPLQLYMAADYMPTRYANVSFDGGEQMPIPHRMNDFSFRIGINLIFGRHGYQDKPMLSAVECPPHLR